VTARVWAGLLGLALLCGCGGAAAPPVPDTRFYPPSEYPARLSAWGLFRIDDAGFTLGRGNRVYDLNTALFTDYALKLRTLYVPPDRTARFDARDSFDFPPGTIVSKTFFYLQDGPQQVNLDTSWDGHPGSLDMDRVRLIETRLLVRQDEGWDALPYIWQGDDAFLKITGDMFTLRTTADDDFNYVVPTRNQCASCHAENHTTGALQPIGLKARHLHRIDPVTQTHQLQAWQQHGLLEGLPALDEIDANARFDDAGAALSHRARSYLDINCGHCHNPAGAADTSGLLLDYQPHADMALGICKPPIAAGRGSGGLLYSIVPGQADQSILTFRMSTTNPATMMPELGRSLVHREGLALVTGWINSLSGVCR